MIGDDRTTVRLLVVAQIVLTIAIGVADAHSWIACADYTEKDAGDWDARKCRGYPRDAARYAPKDLFGHDRGFDHKPGQMGQACKTRYSAGSYSSSYPKAVYYPGQQVIIVHPMKNHGAASCTNKHIPDAGNRIYHGLKGRDRDQIYSYYRDKLVADLGISRTGQSLANPDQYPKPGYQNAPKFCENTDKAFASYSFNIPSRFEPGEYTFVWRWSFNGPQDIYTTCFDVIIAPNKAARDRTLQQRNPSADLSVACGGTLSNEQAGSTEGCSGGTGPTRRPVTQRPTRRPVTQRPTRRPVTQRPTRRPVTQRPTRRPVTQRPTRRPFTQRPTRRPVTQRPTRRPVTQRPTRRPVTQRPTQRPTTERTTQRPVTTNPPEIRLSINAYQMSGEVAVGAVTSSDIKRRFVSVHFDCPAQVSFWNARLVKMHNHGREKRHAAIHYDLVQENPRDVASGKLYFTAAFEQPCNLLASPPVAKLIKEEE